ncbi:MAG: hypothetical protein ACR2NR_04400 [Solirubrobacteraceae bacterium]
MSEPAGTLSEDGVNCDPFMQFADWFAQTTLMLRGKLRHPLHELRAALDPWPATHQLPFEQQHGAGIGCRCPTGAGIGSAVLSERARVRDRLPVVFAPSDGAARAGSVPARGARSDSAPAVAPGPGG